MLNIRESKGILFTGKRRYNEITNQREEMSMNKKVIAVIGCGRIARNAHLPAFSQMDNIRVKYGCDILPEKAAKLKEDFPIIENIIEQGEINLERLGDGKPPFDRPGKFFSLFNPKAQNRLIAIIRNVNYNARVV